ncbi:hypothetical protein INT45_001008 [Circinella minor]|uniref:B-block binding subunit of TFIIIC domain-containing protein n=1 Tax=Circinella minor TaxID=1195481 RepID=A0A8H7SCJ9_9FUNG|nr:hypothetical protein INT45_001008 [Circinella minor]
MCYHIRFAPKNDINSTITTNGTIQHEVVDRKMVQVLSKAKDHMMPLTELFTALEMTTEKHIAWIRNHITKRVEQGIFEKVKVVSDNKRVVYLKWIAPLATIAKPEKLNATKQQEHERQNATLCGEALAKAILKHVESNPGVTTKDLYEMVSDVKWANLRKMLHLNVQKGAKYRLYTIIESQGRVRQYRYFTRDGIIKYYTSRGELVDLSDNDNDNVEDGDGSFTGKKRKHGNTSGSITTRSQFPVADQCENDNFLTEPNTNSHDNNSNDLKRKRQEQENNERVIKSLKGTEKSTVATAAIKSKPQSMKGSNITSNKRKQAITTIVLRDKVREINNDLREEITTATAEGNSDDAPPIARTTLIRLAESLHGHEIIRMVKCTVPIYGGGIENKILLLHPDLDQNSPDVKQYLDRIRTNKTVNPHPARRRHIQEIHVADDSTSINTDLSQRQLESRNIMHMSPEKHWREVAQRHGWIRSKWLRAKVLHEYIFSKHKDVIKLGDLLNELPLNIYSQTIGLYRYSDKVEEFMRTAQKDMALSKLPKDIETEMITSRYRLRHQLSMLVDILEALELLERVNMTPSSSSTSDSTVRLLHQGKVKNFNVESWPVMQTFQINTIEDIHAFWKELQFVCTSSDTVRSIKPGHVLDTILMPHTWVTVSMLTKEQRNILDQHIDRSEGISPVDDVPLIAYLSRTLGLPQGRIKNYFHGFMRAHNRQKEKKTIKSPKRIMVSELIRSGHTFNPAPIECTGVKAEERTFAPTRKFVRNRYPRAVSSTLKQPLQRWLEVEHEALLYAYAIMRHRSETNGTLFSWAPISQVITNREQNACRRRISHLKETWPRFNDHIEILKRKWAIIYAHGIATGELVDKRPWDWRNYDILGQLEYFVTKLKGNLNECSICLPDNHKLLKTRYDIIKRPFVKHKRPRATLGLDKCDTGLDKSGLSNSALLASIVLRMVFMMPPDTYNAEKSRALFRPFTEKTIEQALQYLRSAGALVIMRKNFNRLIPGQVYNVSEKFIRMFTCERFPRQLLDEANEFYNNLHESIALPSGLRPGAIAVMIDMISANKLELDITSIDQFRKTFQQLYYPRLKHAILALSLLDALVNNMIDRTLRLSATFTRSTDTQSGVGMASNGNIKIPDLNSLSHLSTQTRYVYSTLETFGNSGATLVTLKERLQNMSDKDVIQCVEQLKSNGLVYLVGFMDQRLVVANYISSWFIESKPGQYLQPRMWYNIDGSVNQDVFQGCVRKLVLLITEKPGISSARIEELFNGYMTITEVNDLLLYLCKEDAQMRLN